MDSTKNDSWLPARLIVLIYFFAASGSSMILYFSNPSAAIIIVEIGILSSCVTFRVKISLFLSNFLLIFILFKSKKIVPKNSIRYAMEKNMTSYILLIIIKERFSI
ncbi:hypothetical protein D3C86_1518510 [compost metagenome]